MMGLEKELKAKINRLMEINEIISKLDPSIRERAFILFENYIGSASKEISQSPADEENEDGNNGIEKIFSNFEHEKPSDAAYLIAAYHFSQYGSSPFSLEEVKEIAENVGVTIPGRLDMTFKQAKEKGKNLFQSAGRGLVKPTVTGETFLKANYKVKKGTKKKMEKKGILKD